ncbi:MAG: effector-associated domain EAD1-containing protein [Chloroflexota bacterium]
MPINPTLDHITQLTDALLDGFDHAALTHLTRVQLDLHLEWVTPVVGKRDLSTIVTDLVAYFASQEGGLKRLLTAAVEANPNNAKLTALADEWAELDFRPIPLPDDHPHHAGDVIHGDKIGQDKVGGDKIATGDIEGISAVGSGRVDIHGPVYIGQSEPTTKDGEQEAPAPGDPPYMGLNYFDIDDSHLFYGRDDLIQELIERVAQINQTSTQFIAIIGASGSGKSSLVRAGLVHALQNGAIEGSDRWHVHIVTPTARPLESLAISLTKHSESVTATATLIQDMRQEPSSLHLYASRLLTGSATHNRLLLVVDQFEETFTLCKDSDERRIYIDNLLYAAGQAPEYANKRSWTTGSPTIVLLTLRADFYAHCAQFDNLRAALERQQKYIGAMTREELRQAIERPAHSNGWGFEAGLVNLFLDDVGSEPGALPLLSHALRETWERRQGHTLTLAGYTSIGRVHGAVAQTADRIYAGLTKSDQIIARNIFLRLTELGEGAEDTRRRVALDELVPTNIKRQQVQDVLQQLANARLITTHGEEAEVAHEALIREWSTLRTWLDENRDDLRIQRRLTSEAQEWSKDYEASLLYRGSRLEQARDWAEEHSDQLSEIEQKFLNASHAAEDAQTQQQEVARKKELDYQRQVAEQESHTNRVFKRLSIALAVAFLIASLAAWLAN